MARTKSSDSDQEGEISVSMVKFTMKGSDASLQKGLDTIKAAFAQAGFAVVPESRQIRHVGPKAAPPPVDEPEREAIDSPPDETDIEDATAAESPPAKRSSTPKKQPNYRILPEIQIDDVSPTLKEFVAERHGETVMNRYLVIAYWFKHSKGIDDLTVEHWFTAYKLLGWTPPKDPAQAIADLRHNRRQFLSAGKTKGTSTINNVGENIVLGLSRAPD